MTENTFNDNIYINSIIKHKVTVNPKHLNKNIDEYLLNFLKNELEGKCNCDGYIKKDSLSVIKRTLGEISGNRFTGDISYNLLINVQICNPIQGSEIDCRIQYINKLGILGHNGPMTIIVSKQFHNDSNVFQKFKEGDLIKVEIIAKKFLFNDTEIQIIGKLVDFTSNKKSINKKESNNIKSEKSNLTLDEIDDIDINEFDDDKDVELEEEEDDIDEDLDKIELEEEEDDIEEDDELDEDDENTDKKIKLINFKEDNEGEEEEEEEEVEEEEEEEYESEDE